MHNYNELACGDYFIVDISIISEDILNSGFSNFLGNNTMLEYNGVFL